MTVIRPYVPADLEALVVINDAAAPAVPITSAAELAAIIELGSLVRVVEADGVPAGFLITLEPGTEYASENYRWFSARSSDFFYVDRIVVGEALRGQGVGRELYELTFDAARAAGASEVTCEVNLEPPNPGSIAFHGKLGFVEVGQQATKGGSTVVSLQAAPVR